MKVWRAPSNHNWHVFCTEFAIAAGCKCSKVENPDALQKMLLTCWQCQLQILVFLESHFSKVPQLSLLTHSVFNGTYIEHSHRLFLRGLLIHHPLLQCNKQLLRVNACSFLRRAGIICAAVKDGRQDREQCFSVPNYSKATVLLLWKTILFPFPLQLVKSLAVC